MSESFEQRSNIKRMSDDQDAVLCMFGSEARDKAVDIVSLIYLGMDL
jgi:hypothetical protein